MAKESRHHSEAGSAVVDLTTVYFIFIFLFFMRLQFCLFVFLTRQNHTLVVLVGQR